MSQVGLRVTGSPLGADRGSEATEAEHPGTGRCYLVALMMEEEAQEAGGPEQAQKAGSPLPRHLQTAHRHAPAYRVLTLPEPQRLSLQVYGHFLQDSMHLPMMRGPPPAPHHHHHYQTCPNPSLASGSLSTPARTKARRTAPTWEQPG